MTGVPILPAVAYGILFSLAYYVLLSLYARRFIRIDFWKLVSYVSIFCVFGVAGELFTNTLWRAAFGQYLWQYHFLPTHDGSVSYFFPLIWGALGYYKYLNDQVLHRFAPERLILPGIIMGAEAIILEIAYNGLFLLIFGDYIFYYLPGNLGPLSHLSCLEVIPFYFIVGVVTNMLIAQLRETGSRFRTFVTLCFYWMLIASLFLA